MQAPLYRIVSYICVSHPFYRKQTLKWDLVEGAVNRVNRQETILNGNILISSIFVSLRILRFNLPLICRSIKRLFQEHEIILSSVNICFSPKSTVSPSVDITVQNEINTYTQDNYVHQIDNGDLSNSTLRSTYQKGSVIAHKQRAFFTSFDYRPDRYIYR